MITKLKSLLKKYYLVIILALFVGVISSLPRYLATSRIPNFQGVYNQVVGDETFYNARAKDVIDGHPYVTNPYLYEHKNDFPMQFWIPDYILAKPIGWLHLSVPEGFIIWNFFLSAILVILSYIILFVLTESKYWSLLGTTYLHLVLFNGDFLRIPSPGLNFIFFLLTTLFFLLFLEKQKNWLAVLSSLSFGMLFNVYPYYWTFYVVLFAVFLTSSFILKIKDFPYKKLFLIFVGGLIVGIPYFISLYQSSKSPWYDETLARIGLIQTHFPSGILIVSMAFLVIIFFLFSYFKGVLQINKQSAFIFSGVLSAVIAVNQHLITGKNLEFSSHYQMGSIFWFSFVVIYVLSIWFEKYGNKPKKIFLLCASLLIIVLSVVHTSKLVELEMTYEKGDIYNQNYAPIFDWLNSNSQPDSVVFTNDSLSYYVPIYTANNVFFNPFSALFFMSNEEVEKRFIISHYFDNFTTDFVKANQRTIFGGYYIDQYNHNLSKNKLRKLVGIKPVEYTLIPTELVQKVVTDAKDIQKMNFKEGLFLYRVDYVIWDNIKNPEWKMDKLTFLKKLYSANGIIIFKIEL